MFTFLVCGFGFDHKLVQEFLTPGSHFFPTKRTLPPHPVIRDVNAMEVDEEDDLPIRPMPLDEGEAVDMYKTVNFMTQEYRLFDIMGKCLCQ